MSLYSITPLSPEYSEVFLSLELLFHKSIYMYGSVIFIEVYIDPPHNEKREGPSKIPHFCS